MSHDILLPHVSNDITTMLLGLDRRRATPASSRSSVDLDGFVLTVASSDIADATALAAFNYQDPPPTKMEVTVKIAGTGISTQKNVALHVYLTRYALDCVWRDANDPSTTITANSGTSVSKKIYCTFYVGSIANNIRLLKPVMNPSYLKDFDTIIMRNSLVIGEVANNPYGTVQTSDVNTFFENQYTNQNEFNGMPGVLLGTATPQAVAALRGATTISVTMVTDRDDYPSPFWYSTFLTGVSLWNHNTLQYDVVPQGTEVIEYYKKVQAVAVAVAGGPFFPTTLFTFDAPVRNVIAPFLTDKSIYNVSDPEVYAYIASHQKGVSVNITQCGLAGSHDLSSIPFSMLPTSAPSDASSYSVPVYDTTVGLVSNRTICDASTPTPSRLAASESMSFPNGAWKQQPLHASSTSLPNMMSPFPWEQTLAADILRVINETEVYSSTMLNNVVARHNFLFMDPGTGWSGEGNGTTTIGERALQFDFGEGAEGTVNKMEILYPRSCEGYQPVRFGASLQRIYGTDTAHHTDLKQAMWFGGFQGVHAYGADDANDPTYGYAYLNTHSQTTNSLHGTSATLLRTYTDRTPHDWPWSGTTDQPGVTTGRAGRISVAMDNPNSYVASSPTDLCPASDFLRQEFGPFIRGATVADLEDNTILKAVCTQGTTAEWATKQYPQQHYFQKLTEFCLTTQASTSFFVGNVYTLSGGYLAAVQLSDLQDNTIRKYVYPTNFNDIVPNTALLKTSFLDVKAYFLANFCIYLVNTPVDNPLSVDYPYTEYIVKETYYFCPFYNQYDLSSTTPTPVTTVRPVETTRSQKMVMSQWATGRYFGLTFGSFLDTDPASGYQLTRGPSNHARLFAVRLCTQLFDFSTIGGHVIQSGTLDNASFTKTYTGGLLTSTNVMTPGLKYTPAPPQVVPYTPGPLYSTTNYTFVDRGEELSTLDVAAANMVALHLKLPTFDQSTESTLQPIMVDDKAFHEYIYYVKAAAKNPLKRSAEFHLAFVPNVED